MCRSRSSASPVSPRRDGSEVRWVNRVGCSGEQHFKACRACRSHEARVHAFGVGACSAPGRVSHLCPSQRFAEFLVFLFRYDDERFPCVYWFHRDRGDRPILHRRCEPGTEVSGRNLLVNPVPLHRSPAHIDANGGLVDSDADRTVHRTEWRPVVSKLPARTRQPPTGSGPGPRRGIPSRGGLFRFRQWKRAEHCNDWGVLHPHNQGGLSERSHHQHELHRVRLCPAAVRPWCKEDRRSAMALRALGPIRTTDAVPPALAPLRERGK